MRKNLVAWVALALAVASFVGARVQYGSLRAGQAPSDESLRVARSLSSAFQNAAEFVKPSVVQINVAKSSPGMRLRRAPGGGQGRNPENMDPKEIEELLKRFFGPGSDFNFEKQQFSAEGTGSGFVYDDRGHILTNNHVVDGTDKISVTFIDGTELPATVIGTFPTADIAVIKVDETKFRPVQIGASKGLKVGEWVLALGSPFGLTQSVTAGIISAVERNDVGINYFESFIQTDAAINPGNSGGPLVDLNGRVVGINSAIATATRSNAGIGFAIPIDLAVRLANKIIKSGKIEPVLLGLSLEESLSPALARQLGVDPKTRGALVTDVIAETPAAKVGLKAGDVITGFDNQPVFSRKDLQFLVQSSDVGQSYPLTYLRGGKEGRVQITPAPAKGIANQSNLGRPRANRAPSEESQANLPHSFGVSVLPVTPELAQKYGWNDDASGLIVVDVQADSPAKKAGIEVGDRITRIIKNKEITPVKTSEEFHEAAAKADELAVYVEDVKKVQPGQFMTLSKTGVAK